MGEINWVRNVLEPDKGIDRILWEKSTGQILHDKTYGTVMEGPHENVIWSPKWEEAYVDFDFGRDDPKDEHHECPIMQGPKHPECPHMHISKNI